MKGRKTSCTHKIECHDTDRLCVYISLLVATAFFSVADWFCAEMNWKMPFKGEKRKKWKFVYGKSLLNASYGKNVNKLFVARCLERENNVINDLQ